MLETKIMSRLSDPIRLSEILVANPHELTELIRSNGLEGLIAKRTDSVYESGKRSGRWVKLRVNRSQEFCHRRLRSARRQLRFDRGRILR